MKDPGERHKGFEVQHSQYRGKSRADSGLAPLVLPVTHSWSSEPALGQGECYRLTVFGSKNPENPVLWSTILSSYFFAGNGK